LGWATKWVGTDPQDEMRFIIAHALFVLWQKLEATAAPQAQLARHLKKIRPILIIFNKKIDKRNRDCSLKSKYLNKKVLNLGSSFYTDLKKQPEAQEFILSYEEFQRSYYDFELPYKGI